MFSDEIKETVYVAITCMLLALVLGMVSIIIDLRMDLATTRNQELANAKNMATFREFNKYNDKEIYGEDIIEVIREYQGTNVEVYVDKVGGGSSFYMTKETVKTNPNSVKLDNLQVLFNPNFKYRSYLVYNNDDVKTITGPTDVTGNYTEVTGITIIYQGPRT